MTEENKKVWKVFLKKIISSDFILVIGAIAFLVALGFLACGSIILLTIFWSLFFPGVGIWAGGASFICILISFLAGCSLMDKWKEAKKEVENGN